MRKILSIRKKPVEQAQPADESNAVRATVILLNKPFKVICQFSPSDGHQTLADFVKVPDVYPAGRLDHDSEGLLVLTDDGPLQHQISDPRRKMAKTYLAQVDGDITEQAVAALRDGVELKDGKTASCQARRIDEPEWLWPRDPPVRYRASIPTSWISLVLREGKNRQVRRMTAAVGFPTLRLIRSQIGPWGLDGLVPGEWRRADASLDAGETRVKPMSSRKARMRRR